jgi:hypothetical protein
MALHSLHRLRRSSIALCMYMAALQVWVYVYVGCGDGVAFATQGAKELACTVYVSMYVRARV